MSDPFVPRVGGILSADIAVPEHEREVRIYSRVLSTGESPLWREDLMNNLGMPIIGLGARSAEYAHLPLQWMPHIQFAEVAASPERASWRAVPSSRIAGSATSPSANSTTLVTTPGPPILGLGTQ